MLFGHPRTKPDPLLLGWWAICTLSCILREGNTPGVELSDCAAAAAMLVPIFHCRDSPKPQPAACKPSGHGIHDQHQSAHMKIRSIRLATLAVTVVGISTLPSFAEAQSRFRGMARVGLEGGGDTVLQFKYSDGSTPDVTAGGGLLLTGGGVFEAFNVRGHAM